MLDLSVTPCYFRSRTGRESQAAALWMRSFRMGPTPGAQSCYRAANTVVEWGGRDDGGMNGQERDRGPVVKEAGTKPRV